MVELSPGAGHLLSCVVLEPFVVTIRYHGNASADQRQAQLWTQLQEVDTASVLEGRALPHRNLAPRSADAGPGGGAAAAAPAATPAREATHERGEWGPVVATPTLHAADEYKVCCVPIAPGAYVSASTSSGSACSVEARSRPLDCARRHSVVFTLFPPF